MDQATQNRIVSFIRGGADEVPRDHFRRGNYPDVFLPMCVLRRMDAWASKHAPKLGHAVSITSQFRKLPPLRTLAQLRQDIADIEDEVGGLLGDLRQGASA